MASKGKILKKIKEHKGNKIMDEELKDFTEEEILEDIEEAVEEEEAKEQETEASGEENAEETEEAAKEEKDPKQERIEELEDMVKRQLAEFDNFRKRTDKEKDTMFEAGARSVIEKLLPVVDNFERGLASISEDEQGSAHAEGMQMIYKQLMEVLEKLEVKPIEAVGCEFNPDLHNAVMQCESEEYESGIVAQELQKGYTYRDSVIRHSMVAVVS
jgi:molecular chaperone GrpE